jgi:hypothetical protein
MAFPEMLTATAATPVIVVTPVTPLAIELRDSLSSAHRPIVSPAISIVYSTVGGLLFSSEGSDMLKPIVVFLLVVCLSILVMSNFHPKHQEGDTTLDLDELIISMSTIAEACPASTIETCLPIVPMRWAKPIGIQVFISPEVSQISEDIAEVLKSFALFAHDASDGQLRFDSKEKNIFIYIGGIQFQNRLKIEASSFPPRTFDVMLEKTSPKACFAVLRSNSNEVINSSIYISTDIGFEKAKLCLYEELYNSMGLVSDPPNYASIFDAFPVTDKREKHYPFSVELVDMMSRYYSVR